MDRRVMGRQAEIMVAPEARQFFRVGGQLGPLYPRPRLKDFRIVFVDGPLGDSAWEIGVKLIFKRGSYGQTYFMAYDGHNYRVVSGRTGLIGP